MKYCTLAFPTSSYAVAIGGNGFQDSQPFYPLKSASALLVLSDTSVGALYAEALTQCLQTAVPGIPIRTLLIPPGEAQKELAVVSEIVESLLTGGYDRDSVIVTLGGGVILDLGGFVASCYQRGIGLFHIPTTLLAQVDAAFGGKCGVNHRWLKNSIGAFYHPVGALVDVDFLKTLPHRVFLCGIAEMIKYGFIISQPFFEWLECHCDGLLAHDQTVLIKAITQSIFLKQQVVSSDEQDRLGKRALLNFGHTFAHAIETAVRGKHWFHGEAVAVGMLMASRLAVNLGHLEASLAKRLHRLISLVGLPTQGPGEIAAEVYLELLQRDKKRSRGSLKFVLPTGLGSGRLISGISNSSILAAIRATDT